MLKLNIGCGDFYQTGWINTDITNPEGYRAPDILCSAMDLPFKDGVVDKLYAGHVLEHLMPEDVVVAVREFQRVISPNGEILVVLPDLDVAESRYSHDQAFVDSVRFGANRWGGDAHLWESRPATFAAMLDEAGIQYHRLNLEVLKGFDWPVVDYVDWQYGFEIVK